MAGGDHDLAIKTMKQAVLYEAHYSDETVRANKELLCKLMNKNHATPSKATVQPRIEVFYGRTDGTPGYKEYTCVVVKTTETATLKYSVDLYTPSTGCDYKILFEVPPERLGSLCKKAGVNERIFQSIGWIQSVLKYWKENPNAQSLGSAMFM